MSLKVCVDVKQFNMAEIAQRVEDFLRTADCTGEFVFEIHLVVEELLTNVVQHGNSSDVGLCLSMLGGQLIVEVVDGGVAFDPLQYEVQGLDAKFEDRQLGGMGIYLVKEMMDNVSYQYENGKNKLRAVKMLRTETKEN